MDVIVFDGNVVDEDLSRLVLIEPQQQFKDGRLATTRSPY
jgi:hypothetical protein